MAAKAVAPPERTLAVVRAMQGGRVLVPVLAHPHPGRPPVAAGHSTASPDACASAPLTVETGDGRTAMPVFSSLAALAAWHPQARPVPVLGQQAARAAVLADGLMLLDPGDEPVLIPRPAVRALAAGYEWLPAWGDPALHGITGAALQGLDGLVPVRIEPGTTTEIRVVVEVQPGPAHIVQEILARAAHALSQDPLLRERVDTLELYPMART